VNVTPLAPVDDSSAGRLRDPFRALASPTVVRASLALALIASVGGATLAERFADAREEALRALRIESQRLERGARRLDDPAAAPTLVALEDSRDALRVRLVEALDGVRVAPGVFALRHNVEERAMPSRGEAATLRLTLEGRIAHGAALLDLIDAVRAAGAPWPTETRGCLLQRLESGLAVDCAVDLLHWSGLEVPLDE